MAKKYKVVSVRMSEVQLKMIDLIAEKVGLSRGEIIRTSLVKGLVKFAEDWGILVINVTNNSDKSN